ncbi:MAG TPA: VWA-like domain-containing protein [Longimicrobium sp.]|nr:VWA-like domain-containing protein [Longimicrobium sp.]
MVMLAHASAERRIEQATTRLIVSHPFFACMLFHLKRMPDPTAKTFWTDGTHLGYNPSYVLSITVEEIAGVLAHEVIHVVALHPWRQGLRENGAWNDACDMVVNALVEDAGLVLPSGALPGVRDKAPEDLYRPPPVPPPGGSKPPAIASDGSGAGESGPPGDSTPGPAGSQQPGQQPSSQGAPGSQQTSEPNEPLGANCGEVRAPTRPDGTALSEAEKGEQMNHVRIAVQRAANAAQRAGDMPAGLARLVEEVLEPKVPWRELLAQFLHGQSRHDYSWSRPNRRYVATDLMLPSLWSPAYGDVVLGCDTSGSVSPDQLREICSEVLGVLEAYEERGQSPSLTMAWFDSNVYPQVVEDAADLAPQGGGGTNFGVVFDWVTKLDEEPRAVVMVTDGYSSAFGSDPGVPVLWILTEYNRSFKPPFGEIAYMLNE